jgi:MerR, DNA binding/SmpA / OmlA family
MDATTPSPSRSYSILDGIDFEALPKALQLSITSRLQFILRARELGFTLNEIKELLSLWLDPGTSCEDIKAWAEVKIAVLEEKPFPFSSPMDRPLEKLIKPGMSKAKVRAILGRPFERRVSDGCEQWLYYMKFLEAFRVNFNEQGNVIAASWQPELGGISTAQASGLEWRDCVCRLAEAEHA